MRDLYALPAPRHPALLWLWKTTTAGVSRADPEDFDAIEILVEGGLHEGFRLPTRFGLVSDPQEQLSIQARAVLRLIDRSYEAGIAEGKRQVRAALGL